MLPSIVPKAVAGGLSIPRRAVRGLSLDVLDKARFLFVVCLALVIAIVFNHLAAIWIKMPHPEKAVYRRIGPRNGPQVFCAGSSLLQFALSWPEISETLGQGIESWGMAGSTPSEWEAFQNLASSANLMIIGVDVFDMNEYQLCITRAHVAPLGQTIQDLWQSNSDWQFSKRLLSQYPLSYLRKLLPTAGLSEEVLVRLRRKLPRQLWLRAAAEERANTLVLPHGPVLNFGEINKKVSDLSPGRLLRQLALMRSENAGRHAFNGPKKLAFERMLLRAQQQGRVIVVVLPVAPIYVREFVTSEVARNFENVLVEAQQVCPEAQFVRLDQLPALNSNDYYIDLVHLNSAGRRIATAAFVNWLRQSSTKP
jgi:hypothetical protein